MLGIDKFPELLIMGSLVLNMLLDNSIHRFTGVCCVSGWRGAKADRYGVPNMTIYQSLVCTSLYEI